MFAGFVQLGDAISFSFQVRSSDVPADADALPTFRTYGVNGILSGGSGTTGYRHSGTVTGATAASPVVVTSASHGLSTGMRVVTASIGGITGATGTFIVTVVDANSFSLNGSTGSGSYTSGGTWHVAGLYKVDLTCSQVNGFDSGETFTVHASWAVSSSARADVFTIAVV